MSALHPTATAKADCGDGDVCFTPESGHVQRTRLCRLRAKSGHFRAQRRKLDEAKTTTEKTVAAAKAFPIIFLNCPGDPVFGYATSSPPLIQRLSQPDRYENFGFHQRAAAPTVRQIGLPLS
jgi:hypothetical protein